MSKINFLEDILIKDGKMLLIFGSVFFVIRLSIFVGLKNICDILKKKLLYICLFGIIL